MAVISVVVEHTLLAFNILKIGPFPVRIFGVMGVMVFFVSMIGLFDKDRLLNFSYSFLLK